MLLVLDSALWGQPVLYGTEPAYADAGGGALLGNAGEQV